MAYTPIPPPVKQDRGWFKGKVTNQGNDDHLKGVLYLVQVFKQEGFTCRRGEKFWASQLKGELPYEPDVLVERGLVQAVLENDGKSHNSHRNTTKDEHRDNWFLFDIHGPHIPTIRYKLSWLVGKKRWSRIEIIEHFWHFYHKAMERLNGI